MGGFYHDTVRGSVTKSSRCPGLFESSTYISSLECQKAQSVIVPNLMHKSEVASFRNPSESYAWNH